MTRAHADPVRPTGKQMQLLLPVEAQLPGFARVLPETPAERRQAAYWAAIPEGEVLDLDMATVSQLQRGVLSRADRVLKHEREAAQVEVSARLWDSREAAAADLADFVQGSPMVMRPGGFTSTTAIGDESRALAAGSAASLVALRADRLVVKVAGRFLNRSSGDRRQFPAAVLEALAHATVLRSTRIAEVTGVAGQAAAVEANGKRLPEGAATEVKGHVYVRPVEFAAALGWKSEWDAAKGVLTLQHPDWVGIGKSLVLPAVPGQVEAPITVPLWIDQGQPMMTLADLAAAIGGRLTHGVDGVYRVQR